MSGSVRVGSVRFKVGVCSGRVGSLGSIRSGRFALGRPTLPSSSSLFLSLRALPGLMCMPGGGPQRGPNVGYSNINIIISSNLFIVVVMVMRYLLFGSVGKVLARPSWLSWPSKALVNA